MKKEEFRIASSNKTSRLFVTIWKPECEIRAIIQLSHGMIDHVQRYDELAAHLTKRGFLVVGNDHIGHGRTARTAKDYGYFEAGNNSSATEIVIKDLHRVMITMKKQYPGLPYFLLGHSMGSFFARAFTLRYTSELNGALYLGTGDGPLSLLSLGQFMVKGLSLLLGWQHHCPFLSAALNTVNNRRCHPAETHSDWLTKDRKCVWEYLNDPYCQFNFSLNGYYVLLDILKQIHLEECKRSSSPASCSLVLKKLPIAFFSGSMDPVGNYGKAVKTVYLRYKKMGCQNVYIKLYPTDRHEIFNETDRKEVIRQIDECLERFLRLAQ